MVEVEVAVDVEVEVGVEVGTGSWILVLVDVEVLGVGLGVGLNLGLNLGLGVEDQSSLLLDVSLPNIVSLIVHLNKIHGPTRPRTGSYRDWFLYELRNVHTVVDDPKLL